VYGAYKEVGGVDTENVHRPVDENTLPFDRIGDDFSV
jgi:hypothetical protein